jgi:hypothetical protein
MHEHACIFVIKYPRIWIFVIFYNAIMHKNEFGQIYSRYLLKRIYTKFTLHFYVFWRFLLFSGNYLINPKKGKGFTWPWAKSDPHASIVADRRPNLVAWHKGRRWPSWPGTWCGLTWWSPHAGVPRRHGHRRPAG